MSMSEDHYDIADMLDGVPATMRTVQYLIRGKKNEPAIIMLRATIEKLASVIELLNPNFQAGGTL